MKSSLLIILFVLAATAECFSQNITRIRTFDSEYDAAFNYLLEANRPYPDLSSDMYGKGQSAIDVYGSFNQDYTEVSISGTYGLSERVNVTGTVALLTTNYNVLDRRVSGVGDFLLSSRLLLGSGDYFSHYIQAGIKIPAAKTADKLGTGKFDYHFGFVENYANKSISCDFLASFDMLGRPDWPENQIAVYQNAIDSVKANYDFTYQPNYTIGVYPSYYVNNNFSLTTGIDFSRDMRLNYNSSTYYLGFNYGLSNVSTLGVGSNFNILNSANYYFTAVLTVDL